MNLMANAGLKILRVSPESPQSKMTLLTPRDPATYHFRSIWSPDGLEVCMEQDVFVTVTDNITERPLIRRGCCMKALRLRHRNSPPQCLKRTSVRSPAARRCGWWWQAPEQGAPLPATAL